MAPPKKPPQIAMTNCTAIRVVGPRQTNGRKNGVTVGPKANNSVAPGNSHGTVASNGRWGVKSSNPAPIALPPKLSAIRLPVGMPSIAGRSRR